MIWAGVLELCILFFVPETYAPVLLRRKAIKLRKDTGDTRWKAPIEIMNRSVAKTVLWSCIRPFQLLFFEQMCLNLCLLSAILLGKYPILVSSQSRHLDCKLYARSMLTVLCVGILYLFFGVRLSDRLQVSEGAKAFVGICTRFPK